MSKENGLFVRCCGTEIIAKAPLLPYIQRSSQPQEFSCIWNSSIFMSKSKTNTHLMNLWSPQAVLSPCLPGQTSAETANLDSHQQALGQKSTQPPAKGLVSPGEALEGHSPKSALVSLLFQIGLIFHSHQTPSHVLWIFYI